MSDWTAPPKSDPPSGHDTSDWKVDEDGRNVDLPFAIYGVGTVGIRLVARCVTQKDAEFIVECYEKQRQR